jgi:hypothetical protein
VASAFTKFITTIGALFCLAPASAASESERTLDLFWTVHKLVPDLQKVEFALRAKGFQVSFQFDAENTSVLKAISSDGLTHIEVDRADFKPLGLVVTYNLTQSETDQKFTAVLGKDLTIRLNWVEPGPLPEEYASEDWDSMAWPGEEDSAQTIYVVGYSNKFKATSIWGTQIHTESEETLQNIQQKVK